MEKQEKFYLIRNNRMLAKSVCTFSIIMLFLGCHETVVKNDSSDIQKMDSISCCFDSKETGKLTTIEKPNLNIDNWKIDSLCDNFFSKKICFSQNYFSDVDLSKNIENLLAKNKESASTRDTKWSIYYDGKLSQTILVAIFKSDTLKLNSNLVTKNIACFKYNNKTILVFDFQNKEILAFCYDFILGGYKISNTGLLAIEYLRKDLYPVAALLRLNPTMENDDIFVVRRFIYGNASPAIQLSELLNLPKLDERKLYDLKYLEIVTLNLDINRAAITSKQKSVDAIQSLKLPIWETHSHNYAQVWN